MNIQLGIYEVFSRIIPGGLYIVAIAQFLTTVGLINIDLQELNNPSLLATVSLLVVAYILGGAFDHVVSELLGSIKGSNVQAASFAAFKKKHQDRWNIEFEQEDWSILMAFIRTKNLDLASEIDRHSALSIMLRNFGVGLLAIAINFLIGFFIIQNLMNIYLCFAMIGLSTLIIREAVKFRGRFYDRIFETILAYRIDLEKSVRPVEQSANRSKRKNIMKTKKN